MPNPNRDHPSKDWKPGMCMPSGLPTDKDGNPRIRFVKVMHEGSYCVCTPGDADDMVSSGPDLYTLEDTYLSEQEFNALPEFEGF